jgi:hypothetical protein
MQGTTVSRGPPLAPSRRKKGRENKKKALYAAGAAYQGYVNNAQPWRTTGAVGKCVGGTSIALTPAGQLQVEGKKKKKKISGFFSAFCVVRYSPLWQIPRGLHPDRKDERPKAADCKHG